MKIKSIKLTPPERPRGAEKFVILAECEVEENGEIITKSGIAVFESLDEVDIAVSQAIEKAVGFSLRVDEETIADYIQEATKTSFTITSKITTSEQLQALTNDAGPKVLADLERICSESGLNYNTFAARKLTQGEALVIVKVLESRLPKSRA